MHKQQGHITEYCSVIKEGYTQGRASTDFSDSLYTVPFTTLAEGGPGRKWHEMAERSKTKYTRAT